MMSVYTGTMKKKFIHVFSQVKNGIAWGVISVMVFIVLRIVSAWELLSLSLRIPDLSFGRQSEIVMEYVFHSFSDMIPIHQWLVILLSITTALNIILFVIYVRRQRLLLSGRGFFGSMAGMILGVFGVGCVSCGVLVLAPVFTFLGLSSFAYAALEYALPISIFGLLCILGSCWYLLKKISQPLICKV